MSATENEAIIRKVVEELWSRGNLAVVDEYFDPSGVHTARDDRQRSLAEIKETVSQYRSAFPDLLVTIDQLLAAGDDVMIRFTARGTHQGAFTGIRPSEVWGTPGARGVRVLQTILPCGRQVTFSGTATFHLAGGRIVSSWVLVDDLGIMRQLGVFPVAGAPSQTRSGQEKRR